MTATPGGTGGADAPGRHRQWTPVDLLWLLDGGWTAQTIANRLVAHRGDTTIVVFETPDGGYRVTTRVDCNEVACHEAATLPDAIEDVRRDLAGR